MDSRNGVQTEQPENRTVKCRLNNRAAAVGVVTAWSCCADVWRMGKIYSGALRALSLSVCVHHYAALALLGNRRESDVCCVTLKRDVKYDGKPDVACCMLHVVCHVLRLMEWFRLELCVFQ